MSNENQQRKRAILDSDSSDNDDFQINRRRQRKSKRRTISDSDGDIEIIPSIPIPWLSLNAAPKGMSSLFLVEINLRVYQKEISRNQIFSSILQAFPGEQTIVSQESHPENKTKYRSIYIYRILLTFINGKCLSSDLYETIFKMLREYVGPEQQILLEDQAIERNRHIDRDNRPEIIITKPHCIRNGITAATLDHDVRYTEFFSDTSRFSESYRIEHWARDNVKKDFSISMPFISRGNLKKSVAYLEKYLEDKKASLHIKHQLQVCPLGPFDDWREVVRAKWNDWVTEPWHNKKKQLLIVGEESNQGKTMFVTQALFVEQILQTKFQTKQF